MGRNRKQGNEHLEPYVYVSSAGYVRYQHPRMEKPRHFGKDIKTANAVAKECNFALSGAADHVKSILAAPAAGERPARRPRSTVAHVFERFRNEYSKLLPTSPEKVRWAPSNRKQQLARLKKIEAAIGGKVFTDISVLELSALIDHQFKGDGRKQARNLLIQVYTFAKGKGLHVGPNVAEDCLKAPEKEKRRRPIRNHEEYLAIYARAPQILQRAMTIAIISLQSRKEICLMRLNDYRTLEDGTAKLRVIRGKTAAKTEMAFIEMTVGGDLRRVLQECRLDAVRLGCPFFLAYSFNSHNRSQQERKEHWAQMQPGYLSKLFQAAVERVRAETSLYEGYADDELPTFHELRGYGGRLYRKAGIEKRSVQALYGHADMDMTERYLKGGEVVYQPAEACLALPKAEGA